MAWQRGSEATRARLGKRLAVLSTLMPFAGTVAAVAFGRRFGVSGVDLALLATLYLLTIAGIELGFHRCFSHRAFDAAPVVKRVLAIFGSMSIQGAAIWWAASHRKHHECSDRPGDPHSPNLHGPGAREALRGLWHAHMGWLFAVGDGEAAAVRRAGVELLHRYGLDLLRDPSVVRVHTQYLRWVALGLAAPCVIGALAGGWRGGVSGLLWGGFARIFLVNHTIWAVNSLGHVHGRRPFVTRDGSANMAWLAIPSIGASWHNNHHAFPSTAINAFEWWQIDLGGWIVRALERVGLVWSVKMPTRASMNRRRAGAVAIAVGADGERGYDELESPVDGRA